MRPQDCLHKELDNILMCAHLQGEYEDMKDCYKTLLTYIKVGIVSFISPLLPPSYKHHEGMGGKGREGRRERRRRWRGGKGGKGEGGGGEEREGREEDSRKQMGLNEPVTLCCFPHRMLLLETTLRSPSTQFWTISQLHNK